MGEKTRPLKTVLRAFNVLEILERKRSASPSEVAREMDVTRATAHDYLTTLEETGYVLNEDGVYRLGYRTLGLINRIKYRSRFFSASRAPLRKLSAETDEQSHIGIEEDGEWVLLHHEGGVSTVDMGTYPGLRFPLYSQAAGKCILAHLSEDRIDELIEKRSLDPVTENTITDAEKLRAELEQIRTDGYAIDSDQQVIGVGIVASPVLVDNELLGSVSISCPTGRLQNGETRERMIQSVTEAADAISINYRYRT